MIYLDHAATTPVFPGALEAAWPWLTVEFGNPSSTHEPGLRAHAALMDARTRVADWLDVSPHEVVFTSGGTEGNNLAVVGLALANPRGRHIVSARTEHESVLQAIDYLQRIHHFDVSWVTVDDTGAFDLTELDPANPTCVLRPETTLVTLMTANNEIGTIHPIAEVARRAHSVGALVHTDAVQAAAWLDVRPRAQGVDALTVSGHKLGAPKGSGALYVRHGLAIEPVLHGGGQEDGRRSGTENVAWSVALATAVDRAVPSGPELAVESARIAGLRDAFVAHVLATVPEARLTGPVMGSATGSDTGPKTDSHTNRLPSIASFVFDREPGRLLNGETLLLELEQRGVIVSSGAACAAGKDEPSHVLRACGADVDAARTAVRVSLAHSTTEADILEAARAMSVAADAVRGLRPTAEI